MSRRTLSLSHVATLAALLTLMALAASGSPGASAEGGRARPDTGQVLRPAGPEWLDHAVFARLSTDD